MEFKKQTEAAEAKLREQERITMRYVERLHEAEAEVKRLRAALHRIEDLAHDGQSRDAAHAFGRLETIESKAKGALRGEVEK